MNRRYWTDDELHSLRHGFEFHVGTSWQRAVESVADAGTVRSIAVSPDQWAHIAAIVGTRTAEQCAKRLQTERRQDQMPRPLMGAARFDDQWDARPAFDAQMPLVETPSRWHCPPSAGCLAGVDVAPYLGRASGRIVLSFRGSAGGGN